MNIKDEYSQRKRKQTKEEMEENIKDKDCKVILLHLSKNAAISRRFSNPRASETR
jgi:hypothetical protein